LAQLFQCPLICSDPSVVKQWNFLMRRSSARSISWTVWMKTIRQTLTWFIVVIFLQFRIVNRRDRSNQELPISIIAILMKIWRNPKISANTVWYFHVICFLSTLILDSHGIWSSPLFGKRRVIWQIHFWAMPRILPDGGSLDRVQNGGENLRIHSKRNQNADIRLSGMDWEENAKPNALIWRKEGSFDWH
jgi:hypothetical protein